MLNSKQGFCPYPLGVTYFEDRSCKELRVSFASEREKCGIILYDRNTLKEVGRYPFSKTQRMGKVYYLRIPGIDAKKVSYLFYEDDKLVEDKKAVCYTDTVEYGIAKDATSYRAGFVTKEYDWGEDKLPQLSYEESVAYVLHVRGFTKHSSSGVKAKGTFQGIIEKIPYLKELGITTLEIQPAYEFNELVKIDTERHNTSKGIVIKEEERKLNYWGYQEGYYYSPKCSYAKSADAVTEFKNMVKALHANQMELIMQFYFPASVPKLEILDVLRFWHFTYHVDGFHLMGDNMPVKQLAEDAFLADCKLWYYHFPVEELYPDSQKPANVRLATYNDGYMYDLRRLLKGDEGMLYEVMKHMRTKTATHGVINYLTNYYGFTMTDLVTYERKYNEANGEANKDGNDCNFSWNCGIEGSTRKKQIQILREKQIKNAFALLLLSQGTPLFFMGDEFGNSQKGNNNPYCQDNDVTWLNWKDLQKNIKQFHYVKNLIAYRKNHGVFHLEHECMIMDYKGCGYPDISYHGSEAWKPSWEHYSRHMGFMLCGEYAKDCEGKFFYVAINMHWEVHTFALPKLPKGLAWKKEFSTEVEEGEDIYQIAPRSITVFVGEKKEPSKKN